MAIARVKTWSNNEILTHTDLNGEFDNILNNANSLITPWTANMSANNFSLTNLNAGTATAPSVAGNNGTSVGLYFTSTAVVTTKSGDHIQMEVFL